MPREMCTCTRVVSKGNTRLYRMLRFWREPPNFEHYVWIAFFAAVLLILIVAAIKYTQRLGNTTVGDDATYAIVVASLIMGLLSVGSLLTHDAVWVRTGHSMRLFIRLPFVFIGIQMTIMFALLGLYEKDNVEAHRKLAGRALTRGRVVCLACHTAAARSCRSVISAMTVLSGLTTLALAIDIPIISFSGVAKVGMGYEACMYLIGLLMMFGIISALYLVLRPHHDVRYDDGWEGVRLTFGLAFVMVYFMLGFLAVHEVSQDALDTADVDGSGTYLLAMFVVLYYLLVIFNSELLKRYDVRATESAIRPVVPGPPDIETRPAQPTQGPSLGTRLSRWWNTPRYVQRPTLVEQQPLTTVVELPEPASSALHMAY
jgi:hypothetical protein